MNRCIQTIAALMMVTSISAHAADKTDVVIMKNGDQLTGDVKSLERGKLRFDTNATGTIAIEWDEVAYLSSNQSIQVEVESGTRYLGPLARSANESVIIVETPAGSVELTALDVVLMTPIEERGIDRLDGDITAGYSFAKASEVQQFHFGLDMDIRAETKIFGLEVDSVISDSEDTDASQRQSLEIQYTRLRPNRWLTGGVIRLDRNDELGLDLRTSVGVGGGRILRQTNSTTLQLTGGLQLSRENVSSGVASEDTVEAFGSIAWDWFRYDTPELDLTSNLQLIPNLTDTGRVRAEIDVKFRWEIIEDLFWQLSIYDSYDSDPVVVGAEKNDYGVTTSLGWQF